MKVCEKCGAINNNERFFCADCGEKLPAPVSKAYEAEINGRISDTDDKLMRESDPLAVTTFDRITGFVSVGGLLLAVVLLFVGARLIPSLFCIQCFSLLWELSARFCPVCFGSLKKYD